MYNAISVNHFIVEKISLHRLPPDLKSYFWVSRRSLPSWRSTKKIRRSIAISKFSDPFSSLITSLNSWVSTWNWRKFQEKPIAVNVFPLHVYTFNIYGKIIWGLKPPQGEGRFDRLPPDLESYFGVSRTSSPSFVKFAQSANIWPYSAYYYNCWVCDLCSPWTLPKYLSYPSSGCSWKVHLPLRNFLVCLISDYGSLNYGLAPPLHLVLLGPV